MSLGEKLGLKVPRGLEPGTYKYEGAGDLAGHRFHLRVDTERKGVLLIDASKLLFLNGTAVDHVRAMLEGRGEEEAVRDIRRRYKRVTKARAAENHRRLREQLVAFAAGDMDAVELVAAESPSIGADQLPSPYRMDLALTYRCQNDCGHCYNEKKRKVEELPREAWLRVIDRLWEIGIPHIVFTGGEPTLVPFLGDLIERSEANGQITGLITNGRSLGEEGYLGSLVAKGLDHVQVTVLSHRESVHDSLTGAEGSWRETVAGLKAALEEDLYVSTNTTILSENYDDVEETMEFLAGLGCANVAFNGVIRSGRGKEARGVTYEELESLLINLAAIADSRGVKLVWYTPTPYCELNPLTYGLGIKQCTACSLNMAVEPDGTVLPCQSYYEGLGNLLSDDWEGIWDYELCKRIRKREYLPEKCQGCELADVCGGGCPLSIEQGDYLCVDSHSTM